MHRGAGLLRAAGLFRIQLRLRSSSPPCDGHLKRVFHETSLKQITPQGVGIRKPLELGHADLDEGELLCDQSGIGHRAIMTGHSLPP